MSWRNWDEWMFTVPVAAAIVAVLAFHEVRTPSFVNEAIAGEQRLPAYTITVTAKRLPAECKVAEDMMPAHCQALRDATTVTAKANR
jgi:Flp pilus assembly protein CpaB